MAVQDWSTTPASNTTIDGLNIAEGCPPANLNNALRSIMAAVRVMYNGLPVTTGLAPLSGAIFTGTQPIFNGRGAYLHHASGANSSGRVDFLPVGSGLPSSPSNGDCVFFYS